MFRRKEESISIVKFFKYSFYFCTPKKKKKMRLTSSFCVVNMQYIIKKQSVRYRLKTNIIRNIKINNNKKIKKKFKRSVQVQYKVLSQISPQGHRNIRILICFSKYTVDLLEWKSLEEPSTILNKDFESRVYLLSNL